MPGSAPSAAFGTRHGRSRRCSGRQRREAIGRGAAAGLDSGTAAELLASKPFDGAVDRVEWAKSRARDLPGIGGGRPQPVRP